MLEFLCAVTLRVYNMQNAKFSFGKFAGDLDLQNCRVQSLWAVRMKFFKKMIHSNCVILSYYIFFHQSEIYLVLLFLLNNFTL